jgi:hypothetical protein
LVHGVPRRPLQLALSNGILLVEFWSLPTTRVGSGMEVGCHADRCRAQGAEGWSKPYKRADGGGLFILVLEAIRRIEARGAIEMAHRVKNHVSEIFRFAIADGRCESDPSRDLMPAMARPKVHPLTLGLQGHLAAACRLYEDRKLIQRFSILTSDIVREGDTPIPMA